MKKNIALAFVALLLLGHVSFGQALARWEVLEVSYGISNPLQKPTRTFRFLTANVEVSGPASLDWLQNAGWELTGVTATDDGGKSLFFKRRYDKKRTEREIDWLKKESEKEPDKPARSLIDLDSVEAAAKLDEFNRSEEAKLRAELATVDDLSITVKEISSRSEQIGRSRIGAVVVIDGTKELLKDGKNYRSSEAEKFYAASVKQIADSIGVTLNPNPQGGQAVRIGREKWKPELWGLYVTYADITLTVVVVIKTGGTENIVALGTVSGRRNTPKP